MFSSCGSAPIKFDKPFGFTPIYQEGSSRSYFEKPTTLVAVFPRNTYGPNESGYNFRAGINPSLSKTISYEVMFAEDFDFVKGGKLPGLCGGSKATGGNRSDGFNGFSARVMWRRDGKIVSYVYHPDQKTRFGDDFKWTDNQKEPLSFQRGVWHKVRFTVQLNDLDKNNGFIEAYLNDTLVFKKYDFSFRLTEKIQIDNLCFNTFYGGSDPSWAPSKEEKLFIRYLVIKDNIQN